MRSRPERATALLIRCWRRRMAALMLAAGLCATSPCANQRGHAAEKPRTPNIVVVLADDLGYGDLACYGHEVIKTPHLDRFATQGVRLTNCYAAAPNCSRSLAYTLRPGFTIALPNHMLCRKAIE